MNVWRVIAGRAFELSQSRGRADEWQGMAYAYRPSAARFTSAILILRIFPIDARVRAARSRSGPVTSSISRVGVTCQETPQRSLSQPQATSEPPLAVSAAQSRSVSAWSAQAIVNETASVNR